MNRIQPVPVVSADAGDPNALGNPNSAAALARRAKEQQTQAAADARYDSPPPPPLKAEGFATEVIMFYEDAAANQRKEITSGLFLATAVLLALYVLAPSDAMLK